MALSNTAQAKKEYADRILRILREQDELKEELKDLKTEMKDHAADLGFNPKDLFNAAKLFHSETVRDKALKLKTEIDLLIEMGLIESDYAGAFE